MSRKNGAGACGCCSPCPITECTDFYGLPYTKRINRVTLALTMPDEIVLLSGLFSSGIRRLARYSGFSTISGTYTYERDLSTCRFSSFITPDTSDIYLESWPLQASTDCSNIDENIDFEIATGGSPYYDDFMLSDCLTIIMSTFEVGTVFTHSFQLLIKANTGCGGVIRINLGPTSPPGDLCDESEIVFTSVAMSRFPGSTAVAIAYDCGDLSLISGTANSYET